MYSCLILFSLAVVTATAPFRTEMDYFWEKYKIQFKKSYTDKEEIARRLIWEQTLNRINKHNLEADLGMHSYWLQVNRLSDRSHIELNCNINTSLIAVNTEFSSTFMIPLNVEIPDEWDWRKKGFVTNVKNQGECGSCWAFSATGSLEGQVKRKTGTLTSLSEQNLIDCTKPQGNEGCTGGLMTRSFLYVIRNHGLDTEKSYPYEGKEGQCRFKNSTIGATCKHYIKISSGKEDDLKAAVATVGPISVAIHANDKFMSYKSGIYDDPHCKAKHFNHGVLVVGYGSENGNDYWIVKNSWGEEWGKEGYILMARNKGDQCGIASFASYPIM